MKYVLHGIMYLIGAIFIYFAIINLLYVYSYGNEVFYFITFYSLSAPIILVFNIITRKRILKNYDLQNDGLLDDLDIDPIKEVQFPKLRTIDAVLGTLVIISGLISTFFIVFNMVLPILNRDYAPLKTQGENIFSSAILLFGTSILIYYPIHVFNAHKRLRKRTINDL